MMNELKPYPAYKDSGVPWLGEVPEHWDVRRLKYVLRECDTRSSDGNEQLLRVSQYTGVTQRKRFDGGDEPDTRAQSLVGYKCVCPDELVVNIMLAWNGSMGVSKFFGIASPAYCVYRFGDIAVPWYLHYLLRSPVYMARIKAVSTGVIESRLRLYTDDLFRLEALVPPLSEQAAIARFINHADRRISRFIRTKLKLIKLLEEQKQAIIHRAVTRGLDPNVRLKPSGVEWLGDVPEHWEVLPVKRVLHRLIDCEHKTAPVADGESEYRVVRTTGVRNGHLKWKGTYCTTQAAFKEWTKRGLPEPGDVIFTREAPAGEACVVPESQSICLGQRTVLLKLKLEEYDSQFLIYMIYTGPPRNIIRLATQGSTVGHFNMDDIARMTVLKPCLSEQREIVNYIDEETRGLSMAMAQADQEIALIREYRTRLIADVVTGKLDVREAAARLPVETVEPELVDEVESLCEGDEEVVDDLEAITEEVEV